MSTKIENLYHNVIDEFVASRKPFTAYDVTKEVRGRANETVRHYEYKQTVHDYMNGVVDYSSSQHPNIAAILYNPNINIQPVSVTQAAKNIISASKVTNKNIDTRGRLLIPADLLRSVNIRSGDSVNVTRTNLETIVTSAPTILFSFIRRNTFKVDKDNNVRITSPYLPSRKATFTIARFDSNGLVVS